MTPPSCSLFSRSNQIVFYFSSKTTILTNTSFFGNQHTCVNSHYLIVSYLCYIYVLFMFSHITKKHTFSHNNIFHIIGCQLLEYFTVWKCLLNRYKKSNTHQMWHQEDGSSSLIFYKAVLVITSCSNWKSRTQENNVHTGSCYRESDISVKNWALEF